MKFRLLALLLLCLPLQASNTLIVDDISRLNATHIASLISVHAEKDVLQAIRQASQEHRKIAIMATRHSQGGHNSAPDAIVLDMRPFNQIIKFHPQAKTIRVQTGATWAQIQELINPHGLAVAVMQSSNIFSVGGSLSANIHGRDPNYGALIETVHSLRIALADGRIIEANRKQYADLFYSAMGGYGLMGVILEAEIRLTDNQPLQKMVSTLDYRQYPDYIQRRVADESLALHYARLSIVPGEELLRECVAVDYQILGAGHTDVPLRDESSVLFYKALFALSRATQWGKSLRWWMQGQLLDSPGDVAEISRNNAMRPAIRFLEYNDEDDTDILQEYFLPAEHFVAFIDYLRQQVLEHKINLLNLTLRYTPHREAATLHYANGDTIAVVLYMNIERHPAALAQARQWTRKLVDRALDLQGNYYLTYQAFPSVDQFRRAYPGWRTFMALKQQWDPDSLFDNHFYRNYLLP